MPVPAEYLCPITLGPMQHAVRTQCNHRFDAGAIAGWIELGGGQTPCPLCRAPLTVNLLIRDTAFQQQINNYLRENNIAEAELSNINVSMAADLAERQGTLRSEQNARIRQQQAVEVERRRRSEQLRRDEESARELARQEEFRREQERLSQAEELRGQQERRNLLAQQAERRHEEERRRQINQGFRADLNRRITAGEIHFPNETNIDKIYTQAEFDRMLQRDRELYQQQQEHTRSVADVLRREDEVFHDGKVMVVTRTPGVASFRFYTTQEYRKFREEQINKEKAAQRPSPQIQHATSSVISPELQAARELSAQLHGVYCDSVHKKLRDFHHDA